MNKVLELEEVSRTFSSGVFRTHTVRAVDRVSFALERGKTFGLVGNSGCGKTTLSRMITRVLKPSGGRIRFEGEDIARLDRKGSRDQVMEAPVHPYTRELLYSYTHWEGGGET